MEVRLDGKKAVVTGAGRGIGRGISKKLVECGAEVYATSRTLSYLESLQQEVPEIHIIQLDLCDWDKTREELGKLDGIDFLINNAGTSIPCNFLEVSQEDLNLVMNTNFKVAFNVSQIIAKKMVDTGNGGSIVNISSIFSKGATDSGSVYCISKAALDMLTKCMALELGPHKIRVNSVNPTVVWTDLALQNKELIEKFFPVSLTPLGKFAEIEDVANAVVFLLSDKSGMITGETLLVDGGFKTH